MNKKHYSVLDAHPDDETLGCGANIAKISSDKNNVVSLITFTNGVSARNHITKKDIDVIFTHNPKCLNVDHKIVYNSAIRVFRPQDGLEIEINCFDVPTLTDFNNLTKLQHNLFIDVSKHYKKKIQALKQYKEEVKNYPHSRSYEGILNELKTDDNSVGLKFAEKFITIRKIIS
jgi:LmbE family N-acetylglucosaminyl deacetylase